MSSAPKISYGQLAAYGALGLPLTALLLPLAIFLPPFYSAMPGISTAMVGYVFFAARIWDVFTDIGVGWGSDRTQSKFGRRRPWIVAGVPILLIGIWFLFVPQGDVTGVYLLLWSLVAYMGWTLIYLPYQTWGAEWTNDYDQRSRITASRELFAVFGTLIAILLPNIIIQRGGTTGEGLEALFWFLLVAIPLTTIWLLWKVPEAKKTEHAALNLRDGLKLLTQNKPFRKLLLAYLANGAANGFPATLFLFYNLHILEVSEQKAGIALIVYFLSAMIGLPLWLRIGRNWSKHRLWCASMLCVSAVFIFTPFLGEGDYLYYLIICVIGGSCLGIDTAIPASMQADVIDEDAANGGGQRAGLYFGLWGMATKLSLAVAIGVAYPLLDFVGFDAETVKQSGTAALTLAIIYGAIPVAIKLSVVAVVWDYPLDRKRHAELQDKLATAS